MKVLFMYLQIIKWMIILFRHQFWFPYTYTSIIIVFEIFIASYDTLNSIQRYFVVFDNFTLLQSSLIHRNNFVFLLWQYIFRASLYSCPLVIWNVRYDSSKWDFYCAVWYPRFFKLVRIQTFATLPNSMKLFWSVTAKDSSIESRTK